MARCRNNMFEPAAAVGGQTGSSGLVWEDSRTLARTSPRLLSNSYPRAKEIAVEITRRSEKNTWRPAYWNTGLSTGFAGSVLVLIAGPALPVLGVVTPLPGIEDEPSLAAGFVAAPGGISEGEPEGLLLGR